MADIATLGLRLDASQAISGARAFGTELDKVAASGAVVTTSQQNLERQMRSSARAASDAARDSSINFIAAEAGFFEQEMARIKEAAFRGLLSPQEAAAAGRAAAEAYNREVLSVLERGRAASAFSGEQGAQAYTKIAGSLKDVNAVSLRAVVGVRTLNTALASMAAQAAGVNPVLGRLITAIAAMAPTGLYVTAALAGIVAIGFALRRMGEDAREAKARLAEAHEFADELRKAQELAEQGGRVGVSEVEIEGEINRLLQRRAALLTLINTQRETGLAGFTAQRSNIVAINALLAEEHLRLRAIHRDQAKQRAEDEEAAQENLDAFEAHLARLTDAAARGHDAIVDALDFDAIFDLLDEPARIAKQLEFIRVDDEIAALNEIRDEQVAAMIAFTALTLANIERRKKAEIAANEEVARKKLAAEQETLQKLALFAQGAGLIGGAIGGKVGAAIQGGAGGALSGGVLGAQIGALGGPIGIAGGAIIGGITGIIGGLFGASKKAREAAKVAEEAARREAAALAIRIENFRLGLEERNAALTGTDNAAELARFDINARRQRREAEEFDSGTQRWLEVTLSLEREAILARQADDAALALLNEQLDALDEQISLQEQTIAALERVVDSLTRFADSLVLSSLSPLSPAQKLEEARSQFEALKALALGGDISAAESLPGAARSLLEASRDFNASSSAFAVDFAAVQAALAAVRAVFGDQLDAENESLAVMKATQKAAEDTKKAIEDAEIQRRADAAALIAVNTAGFAQRGSGGSGTGEEDNNVDDNGDPDFDIVSQWVLESKPSFDAIAAANAAVVPSLDAVAAAIAAQDAVDVDLSAVVAAIDRIAPLDLRPALAAIVDAIRATPEPVPVDVAAIVDAIRAIPAPEPVNLDALAEAVASIPAPDLGAVVDAIRSIPPAVVDLSAVVDAIRAIPEPEPVSLDAIVQAIRDIPQPVVAVDLSGVVQAIRSIPEPVPADWRAVVVAIRDIPQPVPVDLGALDIPEPVPVDIRAITEAIHNIPQPIPADLAGVVQAIKNIPIPEPVDLGRLDIPEPPDIDLGVLELPPLDFAVPDPLPLLAELLAQARDSTGRIVAAVLAAQSEQARAQVGLLNALAGLGDATARDSLPEAVEGLLALQGLIRELTATNAGGFDALIARNAIPESGTDIELLGIAREQRDATFSSLGLIESAKRDAAEHVEILMEALSAKISPSQTSEEQRKESAERDKAIGGWMIDMEAKLGAVAASTAETARHVRSIDRGSTVL